MRFNKCVDMCNPNSYQDIKCYHESRNFLSKFNTYFYPSYSVYNNYDDVFHHYLVFFLVELHVNKCILYVLLGVWNLHMLWISAVQSLLLCMLVSAQLLQSCPTLCDAMDCSPPGSSDCEILQERILDWVPLLSSKATSWPRDWTCVSSIADGFFTTEPLGKPSLYC